MTQYRRIYTQGATWFFTVNLVKRRNNPLLINQIDNLRNAFRYVKERKPYTINAIVVLPDHLHCIWTLPEGDADYSIRWRLLKANFSRAIPEGEYMSQSRIKRNERGIWQRRFWAHWIVDQEDFNNHFDYIHWNPVKHGYVKRVSDWPHSSFHQQVKNGIYPIDWGHSGYFKMPINEQPT